MSVFLGIDQSYTSTGWVVVDVAGRIKGDGVIVTTNERTIFERSRDVATQIGEVIARFQPTTVAIEGLSFGSFGNTARDLAGLQFTIINLNANTPFQVVAPTAVKKFATGSGKASKQEMLEATPTHVLRHFRSRYKNTTGLFDVVDAYWIACCV